MVKPLWEQKRCSFHQELQVLQTGCSRRNHQQLRVAYIIGNLCNALQDPPIFRGIEQPLSS